MNQSVNTMKRGRPIAKVNRLMGAWVWEIGHTFWCRQIRPIVKQVESALSRLKTLDGWPNAERWCRMKVPILAVSEHA